MSKISEPPYMRSFYPSDMAVRRHISDLWRQISERCGFEEYDGPVFELAELYELKSGPGILSELFHFEDRGGRRLALRPEMTPTLARMVHARLSALPRPIRWFSIPNCCRAERGQRGRLREFWQWNVDVLGAEGPGQVALADAECIGVALLAVREFGLTAADVVLRLSHRGLVFAYLAARGFDTDALRDGAVAVLDRLEKLNDQELAELAQNVGINPPRLAVLQGLGSQSLATLGEASAEAAAHASHLQAVIDLLGRMGYSEMVRFDPTVIRGLAYYTGIVFELFDAKGTYRAIAGGGRYDNLVGLLGGGSVSGVGFGMGDVVLGLLLEDRGLLQAAHAQLGCDDYVIATDASLLGGMVEVVSALRRAGRRAVPCYKTAANVGKLLKAADSAGARRVIILDQAWTEHQQVHVKDMQTKSQTTVPWRGEADCLIAAPGDVQQQP